MYDLSTASADVKRLWIRLRARPTLLVVAFLSVLGVMLLFGGSDPSTGLLQQIGLRETRARGPISRHREPISIVLLAGVNERSMIEVTRAILSSTVGPYELIGVFSGGDASELIVSNIVRHHQDAKVDRVDRGLRGYTSHSVSNSSITQAAELHLSAMRSAKHKYVAIVNANDLMTEYGWDRILLTGIKSSADLMAMSGRAAGNLEYEGGTLARLIDGVGEPLPESHAEDASGPIVHIRQVALRSPILYDTTKMRDVGYTTPEIEAAGMGDLDMCLRGRRDNGYKCGYYPVSVKTHENWKMVTGTAGFGLEMELSHSDIKMLGLDSHRFEDSELETLPAIRREIQDIPMTIVTAITASEIPYLKHLHTTLDWSTHTRYILYLVPTSTPICLSELADLRGIEIRRFSFQHLPQWMQVDKSIGEDALKFHMIKEVMEDYGGLVSWIDANKRLTSEMRRTWSDVASLGVWSTSTDGSSGSSTNPGLLAHFDLPSSTWSGPNCNAGNMGFNSHHSAAMTKIVRPLFDCASDRECIAPPGLSPSGHRQDQAALTVLIHLNGFSCDLTGPMEDQREKVALDLGKCEGPTF